MMRVKLQMTNAFNLITNVITFCDRIVIKLWAFTGQTTLAVIVVVIG